MEWDADAISIEVAFPTNGGIGGGLGGQGAGQARQQIVLERAVSDGSQ